MANPGHERMMICLLQEPLRRDLQATLECILNAMKKLEPHMKELGKSRANTAARAIEDAHNEIDVARELLLPLLRAAQDGSSAAETEHAQGFEIPNPSSALH